jgi:UDP-2,4-diacetamido-2,4,6-trideoxy-beta-L-altropyranose hydrolase
MTPNKDNCRIAIRVDASFQIGTGHFMRCFTLAEELERRGAIIHFVFRQLPNYLETMLLDRKFRFTKIGSMLDSVASSGLTHSEWLGTTQQLDAQQTMEALSGSIWTWLIVDHYALNEVWENTLRPLVKKICVIDDLADRAHDCDLLLDQNFYQGMTKRYEKLVPIACQLVLGPANALLRREFLLLRPKAKVRSEGVRRILVFFGGVDSLNMTAFTIKSLALADLQAVEVDVVIGAQHPSVNEVRLLCEAYGFYCYVQTDRMAEMMMKADLAIGGAGSATWERCCLGLPVLMLSLANNQHNIAQSIDTIGAGKYIGGVGDINEEQLTDTIVNVSSNKQLIYNMSSKAYSLVDGLGAFRVCSLLDLKNEDIHSLY